MPASDLDSPKDLRDVLACLVDAEVQSVAVLGILVDWLRPNKPELADARVVALCDRLECGPLAERRQLGVHLRQAIEQTECLHALTESGMPSDDGFFAQIKRRIGRRLLPEVDPPDELETVIRRVFWHKRDYLWLRAVDGATWRRLMDLVGLTADSVVGVPASLASAVRVLAHHTSSLGLSPLITHQLPQLDDLDSPLLTLVDHVREYTECFDDTQKDHESHLNRALETLAQCRSAVEQLRADKHIHGTSLRLTLLSYRLLKQIDRLDLLLHLTDPQTRDFQAAAIDLMHQLVEAENTRNQLRPHIRESVDLLAYQVVEHVAKKGSKYITRTRQEYWRFFVASCIGGLIVAVFALVKLLSTKLDLSLAGEAIVYSLNYAACFIAIYLAGGALATKQPAVTANSIAKAMDQPDGSHALDQIAEMVVRVWRSQFISFVGNLVCAFPAAILLAELYIALTGGPPASPVKAQQLLVDSHPWLSGALFFAAVAGFFLFVSGLVSGAFDNRNLYRKLSSRVAHHPLLRKWFGSRRAERAGAFVDKHGGVIAGNIFLGFCLGTAGTLGVVFGLPFDIRHIAFSSANVGFALEGLGAAPATSFFVEVVFGVLLIGFINFVVSFGLMLQTAMASRHITFGEKRTVLKLLLKRLLQRPWDYFYPPKQST